MRLDLKVSHEERAELVWRTLELLGLSKVAHYSCDKASKQQLSMRQSAPHVAVSQLGSCCTSSGRDRRLYRQLSTRRVRKGYWASGQHRLGRSS